MNYQALKKAGDDLHRAMVRDAVARGDFGKRDRSETAREVLVRLNALSLNLNAAERRFIEDYVMSQCGCGGGL